MSAADEADLTLARLLHGRGLVSEPDLRGCLEEARAARQAGDGAASLASVLLGRGLASEELLARARDRLLAASGERARLAGSGERFQPGGSGERARLAASGERGTPAQLGPWRLLRELARGGMGAVWEVEHEQSGEHQALKLILERGALTPLDPEELLRFKREAEALGRLQHPGLTRLLDASLEGHPPWFVQELLTGGSLEQRLREGPLPVGEVLELGVALGEALQHAHDRGVLHRDMKPSNVLFDAQGRPRLVDFGLARAAEDHERLTRTGSLLGTPHYMAPEQALGLKEDDPRTDVYGLGGVLYAALTARPPFEGVGSMTVLQAVIGDPPRPPREHRPDVPAALEELVLRALAKERGDRFGSPGELAAALAALRAGVGAAPAPGAARPRSRAVLAAGLLAAGSVLAALAGIALKLARRPAAEPDPAPAVAPLPSAAPSTPAPTPPAAAVGPTRVWPEPLAGRRWHFTWLDRDQGDTEPSRIELELCERAGRSLEGGDLELELEVANLRVTAALGPLGSNLAFDSRGPEQPGLMTDALRPLVGARLAVRVDPRTGEVKEPERDPFPPVDLAHLPPEIAAPQLALLLGQSVSGAAVRRYLGSASHLLPGAGAERPGAIPIRLWVESDWGIAGTRLVRVVPGGVEVSHRDPWRVVAAPGMRPSGDRLSSVVTTQGEARFDERGLLRSRVVLDYDWTSHLGPTHSTCTFLLERLDSP